MITAPAFSQYHVGRLFSLKPDMTSVSGGSYTRVLAEVESNNGAHTVRTAISVPLTALRKPEFLGPVIDQQSYNNLQHGMDLDPSVARSISSLKNIQVEVQLDSARRTFYYGSQDTSSPSVQGTDIRVKQLAAATTNSDPKQLDTPGMGHAVAWPGMVEAPPFTPLSVPFSRLDSMQGRTRIGYAVLDVPLHSVQMTRDTRVDSKPALRQQGTMKRNQGFAYESFTLNWVAQGPEEIYTSVQEVYEQFAQCPFTTAEGGPFGAPGEAGLIPKSIALRSFTVSTVESLPNALEVSLSLDPFVWSFYIQPSWGKYKILEMNDAVCWPLAKLWCKSRSKSQFHGQAFNGRFAIRFPSTDLTDQLRSLGEDQHTGEETVQDVATLRSVLNGLIGGNEGYISSRNAKLIRTTNQTDPTQSKIVAIKFEDKTLFNEFMGTNSSTSNASDPQGNYTVIGLIDWQKRLAYHNYSSSEGQFLPQSAFVTDTYLQRSLDNSVLKNVVVDGTSLPIVDIVLPSATTDSQIQALVDAEMQALNTSSVTYQSERARLQMERSDRVNNKQDYYALVVAVTPNNQSSVVSQLNRLINRYESKVSVRYQGLKNVRNLFQESSFDTEAPGIVFETGVENPDIVVEKISASRNHNLAVTSFRGNSLPLHQHIGGMDTIVVVEGHCFSEDAVKQLQVVKAEFDKRNLTRVNRRLVSDAGGERKAREIVTSFMYVDNEIFHLMGVFFAMPVNMTLESVDEQPGVWHWSMSFIEYDPTQFLQEEIRFMNTYMNQLGRVYHQGWNTGEDAENPLLQRAEEYLSLQDALREEEVYPDLKLPTRSEYEGWITICRRLAQDYTQAKDKELFLERGMVNGKKALDSYELEVLQHVRQFLDDSTAPIITQWTDFVGYTRPGGAVGRYMDPDFFIYYDPVGSWGSVFDSVTEHIMGKPDEQNRARGRDQTANGGKAPQGGMRFIDPNLNNVTSVSDPNYFATIDNQIGNQLNLLDRNSFIPNATNSQAAVQEIRDKVKNQVTTFDNRQRWWPSDTNFTISLSAAGDPSSVELSPEQARDFAGGLLNDKTRNFQEALTRIQGSGNTFAAVTDSELAEGSAIDSFLSLGWRQEKAFEIADYGRSTPKTTSRDLSQSSGDFWFGGLKDVLSQTPSMANTPLSLGDGTPFSTDDLNTAFRLWYQERNTGQRPADNSGSIEGSNLTRARYILMQGGTFGPDGMNYAAATMQLNQNYQSVASAQNMSVSLGQFKDNLANSWNFIDAYSKTKPNVDPHIIRAILIRHDGLGSFRAEASGEDSGFGDFNPIFAGVDNPEARTKLLIDRYSAAMSEYNNVPSVALIALSMEMRTELRSLYLNADGKIPDGNKQKLLKASADIASSRFGREAVAQIQDLISQFPRVADTVDGYFTGYVNLARSHGSYLLGGSKQATMSQSDPFFFGFGGMIMADLGDNRNKYLDGSFSPSGKSVALALDRTQVLPYLANIYRYKYDDKFKPDQSSYEAQLRLNSKLRAAMDPHSEAAIYGALIDMRQHSAVGRLKGAFPAYQILLINEGFYVGNTKLWDQHYSRAGVAEIEVFRSRKEPTSVCNVTLSNMFYNLTAYAQMEALQQQVAVANNRKMGEFTKGGKAFSFETLGLFWEVFVRRMPKELIKIWQSNHLKQLALGVGTRLHVRLGYGANASELPIVFNGTVVNAPAENGYVQLRALGDGYELDKPTTTSLVQSGDSFAFQDGGALGTGKDPASILAEAMIGSGIAENLTQGLFRDFTKGVVHFGEVYFEGVRHFATETQINIYSSKNSRLEQQLPMIQNYFNVSALYNYDQSNLFSVNVKEPTLWKVMEVCRRATLDFVASPEHFTTRSTVFFGKWWWPYNYDYHESILGLSGNINKAFTGVPQTTVSFDTPATAHTDMHTQNSGELPAATTTPEQQMSWSVWNRLPVEARTKVLSYFQAKVPIIKIVDKDSSSEEYVFTVYWANLAIVSYGYDVATKNLDILHTENNGQDLGEQLSTPTVTDPFQRAQSPEQQALDQRKDSFFNQQYQNAMPDQPITGFDYLKDIEVYTQYLKYKTYMQAYIAHSMINLLENKIEASKELVYTDAVGVHKYNGVASPESMVHTIRYSVDTDIQPQDRQQLVVDTGLALTTVQSGLKAGAEAITQGLSWIPIPGIGTLAGEAHDFIQQTPTTPAVENGVVSALVDSVKEMYQGWFVMTGQPTMKPRDLVLLTDHHLTMRGPIFVKEVTHRLDSQNGLITIVSPDCVVYPHGSEFGHQLVMSLSVGALSKLGSFYLMRGAAAVTLGELNHWLKYRSQKLLAGPLGKYRRVQDLSNISLEGENRSKVLQAYKERMRQELAAKAKALDAAQAKSATKALAEERDFLAQQQIHLDNLSSLDDVQNFSRSNQLPDLSPEDFHLVGSDSIQQKIYFQEYQWAGEYDEDVRVAQTVLKQSKEDAESTALAHLNRKRSAWAAANEQDLNRVLFEKLAEGDTRGQFAKILVRREQTLKTIEELKKLETLTAKQVEQLENLHRAAAAENKLLSRYVNNFIANDGEIDALVRQAAKGVKGEFLQGFISRVVDGTFGGTLATGDAAVSAAENLATKMALDAESTAGRASSISTLRRHMAEIRAFIDESRALSAADNIAKVGAKLETSYKFARDLYRAGTLVSYAGPQAILKIAYDVAVLVIGGNIIDGINARWKARQCVKIVPLIVGDPGYAYTAGIRGHQGAVLGDDPSWADTLLYGWMKVGDGEDQFAGQNILTFVGSMLGLEVPDYLPTEQDKAYLKTLVDNVPGAANN